MPDPTLSQLTLSLSGSTALSGGLTLDGATAGGLRYREPEDDGDDTPPATAWRWTWACCGPARR